MSTAKRMRDRKPSVAILPTAPAVGRMPFPNHRTCAQWGEDSHNNGQYRKTRLK